MAASNLVSAFPVQLTAQQVTAIRDPLRRLVPSASRVLQGSRGLSLCSIHSSRCNQRTGLLHVAASSSIPAAAATEQRRPTKDLVDDLLEAIKNTDRGASADDATKARVTSLFEQLEEQSIDEPLKSPLVFGDWDVAYTSSPTAAGGYYRGLIGRALLKTDEMVQTISEPNEAGNRVTFKAFSALAGKVSLKGAFQPLDNKWVEVTFEPPQLELGPWNFTYGGESKVKLSVTYLDERVRLGRGSRGSLFLFVRR